MKQYNSLIFEVSKPGRVGYTLPKSDVEEKEVKSLLPEGLLRTEDAKLPEVAENEVVRHFTLLSNKNYGLDTGFYPLGSCTMKYNPKINEDTANLPGLKNIHPYQSEDTVQGALELMHDLSGRLAEVTGMDSVTLQPAAGAHGEMLGLMLIRAYHRSKGELNRNKIIVPDSAHGTNPASAAVAGFEIVEIKSNSDGSVNIDALKDALDENVAGLMLTNPSTLGLFETRIKEIADLIHGAGGLLYYDGANMNAIMGITRPGDMGFDIVHLNLHKTFSTPHGGGGPGAGPVGVKSFLEKFLPAPVVVKSGEKFALDYDRAESIGKIKNFYGNFGILVRAYTYVLTMGAEGLKYASETAVLNANYMKETLKKYYSLPMDQLCKHEFVLAGLGGLSEVTTLDIAKRLLDYGYHPPTVYFPLIVNEAMMIEPTETESKETLDGFMNALISIAKEAESDPELVKSAPHTTLVKRLDEVKAALKPVLKWTAE